MSGIDEYVKLMLHGDGSDNSTIIVDSSLLDNSVIPFGSAKIATDESKFGGSSLNMPSPPDPPINALTIPYNEKFYLGYNSWTIDFWAFFKGEIDDWYGIISTFTYPDGDTGWLMDLSPEDGYIWFQGDSNGSTNLSFDCSSDSLPLNEWVHIAIVYSNGTPYIFINGIPSTITSHDSNSTSFDNVGQMMYLFDIPDWDEIFNGYISEFRISDTARWTESFIPSTVPYENDINTLLLLHGNGSDNSTMIVDSSSYANEISILGTTRISTDESKFGESSLFSELILPSYFTVPHSDDFNLFGVDWTIDLWMFMPKSETQYIISKGSTSPGIGYILSISANGICSFTGYASGFQTSIWFYADVGIPPIDTWFHLAFVFYNGIPRIYFNGIYYNTSFPINTGMSFDNEFDMFVGFSFFNNTSVCKIDELRFSKGIARWIESFIPPDTESVVDEFTSVLIHGNGANDSIVFVDETGKIVTANGNVKINTTQSKFNGSSIYFDGNGDYLSIADSEDFNFGSIDFDLGCWIYPDNVVGDWKGIIVQRINYNNDYSFGLWQNSDGLVFEYSFNGTVPQTIGFGNTQIQANAWHFISVCIVGTNIYLGVNGDIHVVTKSDSPIYNSSSEVWIGSGSNGNSFVGYIDEVHISKGIARKTGNFSVPVDAYSKVLFQFLKSFSSLNNIEWGILWNCINNFNADIEMSFSAINNLTNKVSLDFYSKNKLLLTNELTKNFTIFNRLVTDQSSVHSGFYFSRIHGV